MSSNKTLQPNIRYSFNGINNLACTRERERERERERDYNIFVLVKGKVHFFHKMVIYKVEATIHGCFTKH